MLTSNQSLPGELQTLRETCPLLQSNIYLANCSQGPLTVPVRTAIETFMAGWSELGMHWNAWIAEVDRARAAFAALIGAQPDEIAVGTSVSQLVSSVASALVTSSQIKRRRIITSQAEFPGVAHAWLATQAHGWQVDLLTPNARGAVGTEKFISALDDTLALVSVPHVCYANGMLLPLETITSAAHANGTLVFVDAYQSIGTIPIDVKASGVDFLAAGTLKFLLGTAGIAFLYVSPEVRAWLEPTVTGWFGRINPFSFDPGTLDYATGAARFDLGTPPIINAYAARAGIELVASTGVARIRAQIEQLSQTAFALADQLGLQISGPEEPLQKGATTAINVGSSERASWLENELRQHAVIVSARGSVIRLAPHGYTIKEELEQGMRTLAKLLN
ncbi:MAG TPA: aminotransferase class V-fold PLP-dependent enzyme [Ktedonobacteraceae bacterium]|nr:aminotransferase class V-fold PLP-dependent enzyme [Ktedonobacteraceae bacterium]